MFLFILETIGTQELILVGIVALIVFGPRKLPQMARKAGQFMREIRSVSNDFRSTWEREVASLEEDTKKLTDISVNENSILSDQTVQKEKSSVGAESQETEQVLPSVRELSEEEFEKLSENAKKKFEISESDKQNWL